MSNQITASSNTHTSTNKIANQKAQIRNIIRKRRKSLTHTEQLTFAQQIANQVLNATTTIAQQLQPNQLSPVKVALFLSIDGEIDTTQTIKTLWDNGHQVYLPRIHPFNPKQLIFLRYNLYTPLIKSPLGMNEPALNCQQLCPVNQLNIIFTPLVAFDAQGHRLGMGGGFYDRTLAPLYAKHTQNPQFDDKIHDKKNHNDYRNNYHNKGSKPRIIGLAHNCQQVEQVPTESWDLPLTQIITPKGPILNENPST